MGKGKRTRWRVFETAGDQQLTSKKDESERDISEDKFRRHTVSPGDDSNTRSRSYKENNKNITQRLSFSHSWNRKERSYNICNSKEKNKNDETHKENTHKFNEDEFVRICTPRSDVLFKKGYLSKLVASTTQPADSDFTKECEQNTCETPPFNFQPSPGASSGYTQDYECALTRYAYYEDNGIFFIPMCNGYNVYSSEGSPTTPYFLMPYSCPFDPIFTSSTDLYDLDAKNELDNEVETLESLEMSENLNEKDDIEPEQDSLKNSTCYQNKNTHKNIFNECLRELQNPRRSKRLRKQRNLQLPQSTDTTSDDDNINTPPYNKLRQGYQSYEQNDSLKNNNHASEVHLNVNSKEFQPRFGRVIGDNIHSPQFIANNQEIVVKNCIKSTEPKEEPKKKDLNATKTLKNILSKNGEQQNDDYKFNGKVTTSEVENKKTEKMQEKQKKKENGTCATKHRKSKIRSKRRKPFVGRQDGFEIIEPDFTKKNAENPQLESGCCEHFVEKVVSFDIVKQHPLNAISESDTSDLSENQISMNDGCNIAALERDLLENLRLFDKNVDLKSPMINRMVDFPITLAVMTWLRSTHENKQELWNFQQVQKLSTLDIEFQYDEDDNISEISETDSDFHSSFISESEYQIKQSSSLTINHSQTPRCTPNETPKCFDSSVRHKKPLDTSHSLNCALM